VFPSNPPGGNVDVGAIGVAGNNTADVTVAKIEAISTKGSADIGAIDFSGVASTVTGMITEITASGTGGAAAADDTSIGNIVADKIGSVTATSSNSDAIIGTIEAGGDTDTVFTDGTVTAIKASGYLKAEVGALTIDSIGSIVIESTDITTTGGNAKLGNVSDAEGTGKGTVGTIDLVSKKADAVTGTIKAAQLGAVTITGATTAEVGAVTVTNAAGNSTTGAITVTAGSGAATLGAIDVEVAGTVTAKSTSAGVVIGAMTFDNATGQTVALDAGTTITLGADRVIDNTKGDLTLTAKAGTTLAADKKLTVQAGTTGTDIDISVDASNVKGDVGSVANGDLTVTNSATDAASSIVVKGGQAANFITLEGGASNTITYYGNVGADTLTLKGSYASSTVYLESGADVITVGEGKDAINLGGDAVADTIKLLKADTASTSAKMDSITNYGLTADKFDLSATTIAGNAATFEVAGNVTAAAGTTNGIATGLFTFDKAAATSLADAITKVGADVATAGKGVVFNYGGNAYLFIDTDGATTTGSDLVIELVGKTAASVAANLEVFIVS